MYAKTYWASKINDNNYIQWNIVYLSSAVDLVILFTIIVIFVDDSNQNMNKFTWILVQPG